MRITVDLIRLCLMFDTEPQEKVTIIPKIGEAVTCSFAELEEALEATRMLNVQTYLKKQEEEAK